MNVFIACVDNIYMSLISNHLLERHIDFNRTKVYLDHAQNLATFPTFNLSGQMTGYQQYNPLGDKKIHNDRLKSKYYTFIGDNFAYQVWGLESFNYRNDVLFIAEGIFDAVRLINFNFPAIAALTCTPCPDFIQWLKVINRRVIAILDNDDSGNRLKSSAQESYRVPDPYKDLGDMPNDDVKAFISKVELDR